MPKPIINHQPVHRSLGKDGSSVINTLSHIAFILDGNRRWAKKHRRPAAFGHREGAKTVEKIALECQKLGITHATFWALSTENLKGRSKTELAVMFELINEIPRSLGKLVEKGIRVRIIGDMSKLPAKCQKTLKELIEKTKHFTSMVVTLAINYGGRDEILRAIRKIIEAGKSSEEITEKLVTDLLDTEGLSDPDLIVRTGGRKRFSGFLPWQGIYAELHFTDTLWPDFSVKDLVKALDYFKGVQRNFGQ